MVLLQAKMLQVFSCLSSKIDWCEPNFVLSSYIAEFWNTVSNIPFLIIAPLMISLYRDYSNRLPNAKSVNIVWICYLIIGIGSVYFHSTLSLFGQFVDEVGILWICCACTATWTLNIYLPVYFQTFRNHFQMVILLLALTATFLGLIKPEINHFFLFLFILPSVAVLKDQSSRIVLPEYQNLSKRSLIIWTIALICWVLDRVFCSFWIGIHFPYLHSVWHVLTALGGYQVCVCFSYSFALEQVPQEFPVLRFYCLSSQFKWLGVWYVSFDSSFV